MTRNKWRRRRVVAVIKMSVVVDDDPIDHSPPKRRVSNGCRH
jgi:hypothetical protein